MTIPIAPPNIGTTGVVQRPNVAEQLGSGFQVVVLALQKRQELEQARQDFLQRREQFELQKKLTGTNIAGMELEQEKTKRAFAAEDADIEARDEALRLTNGGLAQPDDMASWGRIIAGVKDPLVAQHLMANIKDIFALRGQAGEAQGQELQNQQRTIDMAEDRQIHEVLQPLATQQWNPRTINRAIARAVAINPTKGKQVADALGVFLPDYELVQNPSGTISYVPKKPGQGGVVGAPVEPKPLEKSQTDLGGFALRILDEHALMTDLEQRFPGIGQRVDEKMRNLRAVGALPIVGRPIEISTLPAVVKALTREERRYLNSRWNLGNAILRKATGQQINLEEIDRETAPYAPTAGQGDDPQILAEIQARRLSQGLSSAEGAGRGFNPNRLSPAARRLYLNSLVPNPGYSPDNPYSTQPGTTVVPR